MRQRRCFAAFPYQKIRADMRKRRGFASFPNQSRHASALGYYRHFSKGLLLFQPLISGSVEWR